MLWAHRRGVKFLIILSTLLAIGLGCFSGYFLAETRNIQQRLNIGEYTPALPSLLLDRRGKLISQFFAEEKREIVALDELPDHLIYALIAKEDRTFFSHPGFSLKGFVRAAWNIVNDTYFSGGSTISQQVAGTLYEDREVETIGRKIKELFWSVQLEKRRTKDEILEIYFNYSSFGHGTFGVEAAAQFYFGHSARDVTVAESAMLVTQLARINSMFRNPNRAKKVQKATLNAMAEMNFITPQESRRSYDEFWDSYEATRSDISTAHTERNDKAPIFSELVRRQFETLFYGSSDLYRDGYTVHTTLDLSYQRLAEAEIERTRAQLNTLYRENERKAIEVARSRLLPFLDALSLLFPELQIRMDKEIRRGEALATFSDHLAEALEALSLVNTDLGLHRIVEGYNSAREEILRLEAIEGALVAIDNGSGHILAMIGGEPVGALGSNRVVDFQMPVGTAIAPLFLWKGVENGVLMPATQVYDSPAVFLSEIHAPFIPSNSPEFWHGTMLTRDAIARGINVPLIKILEIIGLEKAVTGIAAAMAEPDRSGDRLTYPRKFSIGLESFAASPMELARAYAAFPRQGLGVIPIAIRYIEDRYGNIIYDNEKITLVELAKQKPVMTPQTAFLVTDMLESTVLSGTLSRAVAEAGGIDGPPLAGMTGTTNTWSDAWAVGYSPIMTTAVWFGFSTPGKSLGAYQTGAAVAGPAWARFMTQAHRELPEREFERPENGLIDRLVCAVSGLLPTELCVDGIRNEVFLAGSEPRELCTYHRAKVEIDGFMLRKLSERFRLSGGFVGERDLQAIDE